MEIEESTLDRRKSSVFERHLQTGLVLLAVCLLSWIGITTSTTSQSMAVLDERVSWMSKTIEDLKIQLAASSADRYTRHEAQRGYTEITRRFQSVETRVTKLENAK